MEYLNQKRNIPFEVHAFSSAEMFLEFAKNNETEILLISDKAMKEEIRRYPIRQIIILSEGVHSPVLDQYPAVYKYQSSEKVIREVFSLKPAEIVRQLGLKHPGQGWCYQDTAAYGHFGRAQFPWEKIDRVAELKAAAEKFPRK